MTRLLPALLLALALPAGAPRAQDYASPKAGVTIEYESWRSADNDPSLRTPLPPMIVEIQAVEGDGATVRLTVDGKPFSTNATLRGIFTHRAALSDFEQMLAGDQAPLRTLWPLAPGKTAELQLKQSEREVTPTGNAAWQATGRSFVYRYRVEREEEITVPAGQFKAWVIAREVIQVIADGARTRVEQSLTWYAPALGWWVKFEQRAPGGTGTTLTVREAKRISGN